MIRYLGSSLVSGDFIIMILIPCLATFKYAIIIITERVGGRELHKFISEGY